MRIKMLACLALAVCIFAAPVSAKDKNKTADMFLNGWGTKNTYRNRFCNADSHE